MATPEPSAAAQGSAPPANDDGSDDLRSVFTPASQPSADAIATKEATSLAAGIDLEKDGARQEHKRHQTFRNHINVATIGLFWVICLGLLIGIATYAWHMVTPDALHYLTEKQLDKLQTVLGSAVLSSALTGYVNKRMS
ncbi:Uncharacterised protein [Burkholderia pseudomallei]|uniref:Uncharacterized protein n=1 Tax=Burkholderia glumae TaxID=337 RepID=A0A246MPB1_BURGL|nr:hypothetical protein [Burkholderia glumae]CAJ5254590.1 Uncharacterised protein [Burkholderia pseudomallei]AJY65521.1 hypothetical protein KS03_1060 [Burkholderia glumae LMG 2196 = ATCC 33617]PNL02944.1 hypothetical protein CEQ24_029275 [Burkholderia glumae]PNL02995.1 hypothetical protein CEQ24_029545 [Burkholderia glumae]QPQ91872.1 hypothetical protein I6H06_22445 [Burkholderia glumae]